MTVQTRVSGGVAAGADPGPITVMLTMVQRLAKGIHLYELRPLGGSGLPPASAGAHIDLILPNGVTRQFSLIESDDNPEAYRIAVKREAESRGGSSFLHERLRVGDTIRISAPRNTFPLHEEAERTVLIAGGIGITPILAMLRRAEMLGLRCELHYAARSRGEAAFLGELSGRADVHLHFDDEAGRLLDIAAIVAAAPAEAHLYCCGPLPMLQAFEAAAAGRPSGHVHVEYFTAKEALALEGGFVVELARSGLELPVPPGKSILDVVRDAGVSVTSSCEEGICGSCETRLIAGEPDHRDSILTPEEQAANESLMICCAGAKSDRLVLDL